jgi:hypothetical protein
MNKKDSKLINCFSETPSHLIWCAFRYFLGRRTAATASFANDLAKALPHLHPVARDGIIQEFRDACARDAKDRAGEIKYLNENPELGPLHCRAAWISVLHAHDNQPA